MKPRISVVLVTYRSRATIDACLDSVRRCREQTDGIEVIVVDNASGDGTLQRIAERFPWAVRVANATNEGFTRGVNQGIALARGDAMLLLNPDAEFTPAALDRLFAELEADPDLAAVAPALVDGDGRVVRSCGRFPNLWTLICDHLGPRRWWGGTRLFGGYKYGECPIDRLQDVDWASGAVLLVRRAAWDRVGPLDERIFMFMEEVDWCRRAALAGFRIRFVPAVQFVHHGQHSSSQVRGESYLHNLRARVHYFRKHHGWLASLAARAILLTGLAAKCLIAGFRFRSVTIYARGFLAVWERARRAS